MEFDHGLMDWVWKVKEKEVSVFKLGQLEEWGTFTEIAHSEWRADLFLEGSQVSTFWYIEFEIPRDPSGNIK